MAHRNLAICTLVLGLAVVVGGIAPRDRATWWMEVLPVLLVLPLLWWTRDRFPLTPLLTLLIAIHGVILCYGAHYTYAEVPLGHWARDAFGLARNHYDRLGHFAQGFVPAIAVREVLLRCSPLQRGRWLFFLVTAVCLAISALYELIEWWAALAFGGGADAFLGTQGDVWDTQSDMFLCLIGALVAQVVLARLHDRQLGRLPPAA